MHTIRNLILGRSGLIVGWLGLLFAFAASIEILPVHLLAEELQATERPFQLVVMDPLAAPLSCPCVEGYAQRNYEKLGEFLERKLNRPVAVTFAESLPTALSKIKEAEADLVIGKDSVVRADAKGLGLSFTPVAMLTGKDGKTTQTGLIVVPSADPAQRMADLNDYRVMYGPAECDEKFSAARALLESSGIAVSVADQAEVSVACSDGACKILELGAEVRAVAVISSYAAPLLEGCGTIKKGDLRVVGETAPVPFVTAFISGRVPKQVRATVEGALLAVATKPQLIVALETLVGFVPLSADYRDYHSKEAVSTNPPSDQSTNWPGWRGPSRDGTVSSLPDQLLGTLNIVWKQPLLHSGLGGVAATHEVVVASDRDFGDLLDVFHCYAADSGELLWTHKYPAIGQLDYGNTPRATPLIHGPLVYLAGAFGDLHCVRLADGEIVWKTNLRQQFNAKHELIWGTCASPLLVDGKLIVCPGAPNASVVALDAKTGSVIWKSSGDTQASASPLVAKLGGVRQLIAFDRTSMVGRDIESGHQLWKFEPPLGGDFNVPTPVVVDDDHLLLTSENNATRLYQFDADGKIVVEPVAEYEPLCPDMSTPVVIANRAFCVQSDLYCLDTRNGLRPIWIGEDQAFTPFGAVIGSGNRLLVQGRGGELLLIDAKASSFRIVSRLHVFPQQADQSQLFSHPALVGNQIFVRGQDALVCVKLAEG